jgi:hypothetical protein
MVQTMRGEYVCAVGQIQQEHATESCQSLCGSSINRRWPQGQARTHSRQRAAMARRWSRQ